MNTTRASNQLLDVASVRELARALGCSPASVEGWRSGRCQPSDKYKQALVKYGIALADWDVPEPRRRGKAGPRAVLPPGVSVTRLADGTYSIRIREHSYTTPGSFDVSHVRLQASRTASREHREHVCDERHETPVGQHRPGVWNDQFGLDRRGVLT